MSELPGPLLEAEDALERLEEGSAVSTSAGLSSGSTEQSNMSCTASESRPTLASSESNRAISCGDVVEAQGGRVSIGEALLEFGGDDLASGTDAVVPDTVAAAAKAATPPVGVRLA